jgi:hypothetical protein
MRRGRLMRAVSVAVLVLGATAALAGSSGAATPRRYVLRHPKREHCRRHYRRTVVTVRKRIHGHTRKVRETVCVRRRRKPLPRPSSQPTPPEQPPAPASIFSPATTPRGPREPRIREPRLREREEFEAACTSTFTGAADNSWGDAANWTEGLPSGVSSFACIAPEYPNTVKFAAEIPAEVGGLWAEDPEGLTLERGDLILADPGRDSLINNVKPGSASVAVDEGVTLALSGSSGQLGGDTWNGPGTLEIPRGAFLRTGTCASWGGEKENRCVEGIPTPGYEGLQVKNLGTIWGAGISLCGNGAGRPAKLENRGALRIILSGSFDDAPGCSEPGPVVNGESGIIAIAQLDGDGCNVRVSMGSLLNKGMLRVGSCLKPETEEVRRATLAIAGSLSEAGSINDAGIVQVQGDYTPISSSDLTVSIRQTFPAGSPETNFGAVKAVGSATLGGELNIETDRVAGRSLALGERFQILDVGGTLSGEFALGEHCIPGEPGYGYKVDYRFGSKGTVTLEVAEEAGC